jgi:hypothetical protein
MRYYQTSPEPNQQGAWVEVDDLESIDDPQLRNALVQKVALEAGGKAVLHVVAGPAGNHLISYEVQRGNLNLPSSIG